MLNIQDLSIYIYNRYKDKYEMEISPIKLQKSLYFLYAYYQLFRKQIQEGLTEIDPDTLHSIPEYLFEFSFEAWTYGPVNREIYGKYKHDKSLFQTQVIKDIFEGYNPILKEYIDGMLANLFETNDFTLVNMSHQDRSWKEAYEQKDSSKSIMDKDKVIVEYEYRATSK